MHIPLCRRAIPRQTILGLMQDAKGPVRPLLLQLSLAARGNCEPDPRRAVPAAPSFQRAHRSAWNESLRPIRALRQGQQESGIAWRMRPPRWTGVRIYDLPSLEANHEFA